MRKIIILILTVLLFSSCLEDQSEKYEEPEIRSFTVTFSEIGSDKTFSFNGETESLKVEIGMYNMVVWENGNILGTFPRKSFSVKRMFDDNL